MNRFHIVDYILFVVMLLVSLGIGIYSAFTGGRQKTTSEYLMGNRQLKLAPVALSICVSMVSANTLVPWTDRHTYTFVWCDTGFYIGTSYLPFECHQHP